MPLSPYLVTYGLKSGYKLGTFINSNLAKLPIKISSKILFFIAKIKEFLGVSILIPSFLLDNLIFKSLFPIRKFIKPNFFFK